MKAPRLGTAATAKKRTVPLQQVTSEAPSGRLVVFFVSSQELESTLNDPEVAELDVVGSERPYVEACGAAVRRMSADFLARGLKGLNQTDVGGALQVCEAMAMRTDCCR